MALNKSKILTADDVKLEEVAVQEWGGSVFIKVLSGTDRDRFEDAYSTEKMKNFRARFLVMTLCDEKGERLFTDDEMDALGKKSSVVLARIFEKAWSLNAFRNEDIDSLGKDSASDQSGGSTSA